MIALKLLLVLFALVALSFVSVSAADNIFICESGSSNVTCCASADEVELIQKHKCTDQNLACTAAVQIKQGKCNNRLWSDPNKLSELHCTPTINGQALAGSSEFKCCGKNTELVQYSANCAIVGDCPKDGLNRCGIDKTKWYRFTCGGSSSSTCCSPITYERRYRVDGLRCTTDGKQDCTNDDQTCGRH